MGSTPSTLVADNGTGTSKRWWFTTDSGPYQGLNSAYEEYESQANGGATLLHKDYAWTQNTSAQNVYMSAVTTTLNPGAAYQAQTKTEQTLDAYGDITETRLYNYGALTTPARTYDYYYLTNSNYTSRYIRNRLTSATLTAGGSPITLVTNTYDTPGSCGGLADRSPLYYHDSSYGTSFFYRGNLTGSTGLKGSKCYAYEITGMPYATTDAAGQTVSIAVSADTNYSLPGVLTPNGNDNLATSIAYNAAFAVTGVSGANGASTQTTYDNYGRPATSTSADGAVTSYSYAYSPPTQTATLGTRWKRTTMDGFGRTVMVETGHDSTTVAVVETQYAPCACSPLGKLYRVSQPHAPGFQPIWATTYAYDGSGRTLSVTAPDGSATSYVYQGNNTTVTDPAGKWKKLTTDAFGNLVRVTEPRP